MLVRVLVRRGTSIAWCEEMGYLLFPPKLLRVFGGMLANRWLWVSIMANKIIGINGWLALHIFGMIAANG